MFKIYSKTDEYSLEIKSRIISYLEINNFIISNLNYKYVITIGGDGTFIEAINSEIDNLSNLIFIPINTGHLGFYTEKFEDFVQIIDNIDKPNCDKYRLLKATTADKVYYALNEFSLNSISKTLIYDYYIDGEHLQSLRGSGIIVSTAQGSTAMSKSYNGAVVYPNSSTFQITEVSSINNNVYRTLNSSIILSSKSKFSVVISEKEYAKLNFDTKYDLYFDDKIEFGLSKKYVNVKHLKKSTFTKRIKDGFIK